MFQDVLKTRLLPPRLHRRTLYRAGLSAKLRQALDYRLTLVHAGAGYGKSTALVSALHQAPFDVFWYSLTPADRDARLFLLHLIHAFRMRHPRLGEQLLERLHATPSAPLPYLAIVDALSNELVDCKLPQAILVLDDYHLVNSAPDINASVDHLIEVLPPALHLVISARYRPALPNLVHWRVKGDVLEITQADLAFSAGEIEALFRTQYGLALDEHQVQRLAEETEGWIIALQMVWQGIQSGIASSLDQILQELPRSMQDLFDYLAREVLARRPAHVQELLLHTSVLRQLDPAACDFLLGRQDSKILLDELEQAEFFVVRSGDIYRYHHLFHDFLRQQLAAAGGRQARALHRQAAQFYKQKEPEEAVYHLLAAEEYEAAAGAMVELGEAMVRGGRLDTMNEWVIALPPSVLERFPGLMYQMGELCRFASRFDEALAWYEQAQNRCLHQHDIAGASRALRGQAAVYLDTVRPIKAESLLQEALRLVDGQPDREERARLIDLMAENMTNRGRWEEAEALRRQARELREEGPSLADLDVRVLLRTGRLNEARAILEERAAAERRRSPSFREPRAHRETFLVLSLIYAFQGMPNEAFECAREGIEISRQLGSPFVEAVGYMRLGHAWQVSNHPGAFQRALDCYQRAIDLGERLAVPRAKVEALWGLCRLHGYNGGIAAAQQCAREGSEIGLGAGDEWIVALIDLTLGASHVLAGQEQDARRWLDKSADTFQACGDPFGQAAARLWQCALYQRLGGKKPAHALHDLLNLIETHAFEFLFERPTFLGANDPALFAPLLAAARQGQARAAAERLAARMGLPPAIEFHPGYTLRVYTLGRFAAYRGQEAIGDDAWRRDKARQLFQLLLINRERFMERDEIAAQLWPGSDSPTALAQQFKVTLNALQQALEPRRPPRAPALFVQRQGSAYRLNPAAPLWVDAAAFEQWLERAENQEPPAALDLYTEALDFYQGDFLPTCLYDDWCQAERERLRQLYLAAALKAARALAAREQADEAIRICRQALEVDKCCEPAYQCLMQAYACKRDFVQALRAYERCAACLKQELDVAPMPETTALHEAIRETLIGVTGL